MKPALKLVATSAFRIEKGVPIATHVRGTILYPFADMAKGDSFLVPTASPEELRRACNGVLRQARLFQRRFSEQAYEFTTRRVDGGVRCWRVK